MRLCILCLILIASLFSCSQAVITDFIPSSVIPFSKPNDIVRAYGLYSSSNPTTLEDQILNPPNKASSENFYYHTYGDFITSSIKGLDNDADIFNGEGLGQTLNNLQTNVNTRAKIVNSVMLQHLPSIYKISDISSTKYDQMIIDFGNLNSAFFILRMQALNTIDTINLFKNSVAYNTPTPSKYYAAMNGYGEIITSIHSLIAKVDSAMDAIVAINTNLNSMKTVAQNYAAGTIDEATYISSLNSNCQNIKVSSFEAYTKLYFYSKVSTTQA